MSPARELSDEAIERQAEALSEYIRKPGSLGASFFARLERLHAGGPGRDSRRAR